MSKVWVLDYGNGDIQLYKTKESALKGFEDFLNVWFTGDEKKEAIKEMEETNCCEGYQIYSQEVWD